MKKILITLFILVSVNCLAINNKLKERLDSIQEIAQIETLESDLYPEKYLIRFTQLIDPKNPAAGTFTQRVIISHIDFDRPTVIITEGYGAAGGLNPKYHEELSRLFNTNVIQVEHRYFLESTPDSLNWNYLTAENSAYDLHHVTNAFKPIYPGKWISTGISKGGQTVMIYRAFFPDDIDISVPYVGPLCRSVEDGRHEPFLEKKVGTKEERQSVFRFQKEVLKRRTTMIPLLEDFCQEKGYAFNMPMDEVLDYCVLEYAFSFWQWGSKASEIPSVEATDQEIFNYLMKLSNPDYFSKDKPISPFFVQAARELGYYGYDTKPFKKLLSIKNTKGYLNRIMLPESAGTIRFNPSLYKKVSAYLKKNDPKMICIYGEIDPWTAPRVPDSAFKGKKNMKLCIQPGGSHLARISNMPEDMKKQIIDQINRWLEE